MPEEEGLAPLQGELVNSEAATELGAIAENMQQLLQVAVASLQLQNVQNAQEAARRAEALYAVARMKGPSSDLLLLEAIKHMVCLYAPLTRVMVFQVEGRFSKAQEEVSKGLKVCDEAIRAIDEYAAKPEGHPEAVDAIRPALSVLAILLKGGEACIRADVLGYQGRVSEYLALLRVAVAEYRRVTELPPSSNPIFIALSGFCSTLADRLETRVEFFELKPEVSERRLTPIGNRIFIIHGHDEAKWRELRDLLEDEFKQETVVLEDEVDAGTTVIQKFEEYADESCYAFALLTPDDVVGKGDKSYSQARPNVLFELGWFYGRFGRERVCIVKKKGTEIPSDLAGILYIEFSDRVSEAEGRIRRELKRIGSLT